MKRDKDSGGVGGALGKKEEELENEGEKHYWTGVWRERTVMQGCKTSL